MNDSRTRAMQLQFQYCDLSANRRSRAYQVARLACYIAAVFITIGSLFLSVVQAQPTGQKRKVLILNSYHRGYDWSDEIMDAVQAEFEKTDLDVELAFEYMDTRRYKFDEAFPYLKELYQSKYHDVQFDVIISSDDNALYFLLEHRDFLFPGVPVVFCGVQQFEKLKRERHSRITGVLETYDYESTIRIAVKLHPSARQIVVIAEGGKAGFTRRTGLRDVTLKLDRQVELVVFSLAELSMVELLDKIEELGDESVVLFDSALTDREGSLYSLKDSVRMVREHCAAPIYITGLRRLGLGPVGGKLTNSYHQGQAATEMAIRILNGESADNIPILRESPNAYMFDYVQLKQFEISLSDLPEGSIIINEPESFYYQYKGRIWVVIAIIIILTVMVIILAANTVRRKKAEEKLFDYQGQLKSLTSRLTLAEERERRRIAMELHDRISQSLTISKLELDELRSSAAAKRLAKKLKGICNSLGQAIADTRSLTFDLSSPILYELGFEAAVAGWLSEQIEKKHGIATNFEDDNQPKPLDDDVGVLLFRDVRELLINVVKHANAKKIKVSMCRVGGDIEVRVEDDGWGFDAKEAVAKSVKAGGFGLFSIKERLEELGGHLEIESEAGCGTKVTLIAPLKQEKVDMGVKK